MLVLSDICDDYDEMERECQRYTYKQLLEKYDGKIVNENSFLIELENYVFTVKRIKQSISLSNQFDVSIYGTWITVERW